MLLRRVSEHVKTQNWFAVLLDFLIVIIGVFLGIQVNNWNEARLLRAEETFFLERLLEDIQASIEASKYEASEMKRQAEQATVVLKSLDACDVEVANRADFAQGVYTLGKFDSIQLVRTAYDELKSTGKVGVISNTELRNAFSELEREAQVQISATQTVRMWLAPHIQHVERNVRFDVTAPRGGNAAFEWRNLHFELDKVCNDPVFKNSVAAVRNHTYVWLGWSQSLIREMNAVKTALESELASKINAADQ